MYYFLFTIQSKEWTLNNISTGTSQYWGFRIQLPIMKNLIYPLSTFSYDCSITI